MRTFVEAEINILSKKEKNKAEIMSNPAVKNHVEIYIGINEFII